MSYLWIEQFRKDEQYFVSHGGSGDITQLKVMCDWLELKTVGPAIVVNGNNITSKNLSDIENKREKC